MRLRKAKVKAEPPSGGSHVSQNTLPRSRVLIVPYTYSSTNWTSLSAESFAVRSALFSIDDDGLRA